MTFQEHLLHRRLKVEEHYVWVDWDKELVTFPLYNKNLVLTGYLQYNWRGTKGSVRRKDTSKYYPYYPEGDLAPWGLDTLNPGLENVYVVEGVFDALAIQALGYNAIAVLCNNPKPMRKLLNHISKTHKLITVCDGDEAGKNLAKYGDAAIYLPEKEDAASLPAEELRNILEIKQWKQD
jgi:DNA primase